MDSATGDDQSMEAVKGLIVIVVSNVQTIGTHQLLASFHVLREI